MRTITLCLLATLLFGCRNPNEPHIDRRSAVGPELRYHWYNHVNPTKMKVLVDFRPYGSLDYCTTFDMKDRLPFVNGKLLTAKDPEFKTCEEIYNKDILKK